MSAYEAVMKRFSPSTFTLLLLITVSSTLAQDTPPKQPPGDKKVWTNDDVSKLPAGGVNVVGQPRKNKDFGDPTESLTTKPKPAALKTPPKEVCESDTWAAGITLMLRAQGVPNDENFWGLKVLGGPCAFVPPAATMAKSIDGDYSLDDGSKIRIHAAASSTLPSSIEMVKGVHENRPFLIGYDKQCWISALVDYQDVVMYDNGGESHDYIIKKITFIDPVRGNKLIFEPTAEQLAKLTGVITTSVEKRK